MPNRRALVVYDSKYGATEQIANWITEGINDAEIQHIDDVTSLFYDLIVVGSPIYNDTPLIKVLEFLEKNKDNMSNKKVALFTVSLPPEMTPDRAKRFVGKNQAKRLVEHTRGNIIDTKAFLGKIEIGELSQLDRLSLRISYFIKGKKFKDVNFMNREEAVAWGRKLYDMMTKPAEVTPQQPQETSKKTDLSSDFKK